MRHTDDIIERYGCYVSISTIRRVWDAVTQAPQATVRELAQIASVEYRAVAAAIRYLHDCGYIDAPPMLARARRVILPFRIIRKG
jgi:hypothetical protein